MNSLVDRLKPCTCCGMTEDGAVGKTLSELQSSIIDVPEDLDDAEVAPTSD